MADNPYGVHSSDFMQIKYKIKEEQETERDAGDSEPEVEQDPEPETYHKPLQTPCSLAKRNKRKNFEPRCTNVTFSDCEDLTSRPRSENELTAENNNNGGGKSRRKMSMARKLITNHALDLSKNESDSSRSAETSSESDERQADDDVDDADDDDGERPIPNSFSIHNLSKSSTTPDFQQLAAAAAAASYHAQHALLTASAATGGFANGNGGAGAAAGGGDMRDYAMNTMRELLGIYGLTYSEVAESITRQLPLAAFASGHFMENLSLHQQPAAQRPASNSRTPPSRPPTPPSTPLSPKNNNVHNQLVTSSHLAHLANLASNSSRVSQSRTSPSPSIPQGARSTRSPSPTSPASPLNLMQTPSGNKLKGHAASNRSSAGSVNGHGGGVAAQDFQAAALNLSNLANLEYSYGQLEQLEAFRNRSLFEDQKQLMNTRGIFPHLLNFAEHSQMMKSEDGSPPPSMETSSPLNAIMSFGTAQRDSLNTLLASSKPATQIDYSKYVKKFSSALECGSPYCKELNYREHFHCLDCNSRVFIKKEEMIRHFKWHKKRDESLQHGFMRYSPLDDCSDRYGHCCTHNKKQTHYHCIKEGCDKVYISTSDVQMHANYHRKDSAIIQEGFQRFRATEECGATYCAFYGQRTTHFHCRRSNCRYTFKNKSDMEKHKTYHIKDEQLSRDGFKKFMKNEACPYESCRFSKVCNHIHCIRPQCNYVLHSSGQLFSHKRKHERKDSELAYRKYKLAQSMMKSMQDGVSGASFTSSLGDVSLEGNLSALAMNFGSNTSESDRNSPISYDEENSATAMDLTHDCFDWPPGDEDKLQLYSASELCGCPYANAEHYHCNNESCEASFPSREVAREHARLHDLQEQTELFYNAHCEDATCVLNAKERHYHCTWDPHCREVIPASGAREAVFKRLEHYKMHEYAKKLSLTKEQPHLATSIDGMFARKRGRPPKNRVVEVWNEGGGAAQDSPQAIFTSFKLPKPSATAITNFACKEEEASDEEEPSALLAHGSAPGAGTSSALQRCQDQLCLYNGQGHFHCPHQRCLYVTDKEEALSGHCKDFHELPRREATEETSVKEEEHKDSNKVSVVKASGTFYPLSTSVAPPQPAPDKCTDAREAPPNSADISGSNTLYGPEASCSRPFCKLKRKYHYHCNACNQAFSEIDRLVVHVAKHSTGALSSSLTAPTQSCSEDNNNRTPSPNPNPNPNPNLNPNLNQISLALGLPSATELKSEGKINVAPLQSLQNQKPSTPIKDEPNPYLQPFDPYHFNNLQFALMQQQQQFLPQSYATATQLMFQHGVLPPNALYEGMSPLAAMAANLNKRALDTVVDNSPEAKKARIQSSMRILKDEPVPEGYLRFRFNEDCQYQHCGYREHQTHFHCQRVDCGYSFCDKTRFVQHTARHERLDTLMGGDFQQYRANVSCGRPDCAYTANLGSTQNKASHFHCLKCEFVCTDTNKVVAHRRQHQKLDSIQAAGFEKFTPSQQCRSGTCQHSGKQTHYHCLQCQYAVLGLAQMSAHKYRHMEG